MRILKGGREGRSKTKGRLWFDIARKMVYFFSYLEFKAKGVKSNSGKIDGKAREQSLEVNF